MFIRLTTCMLVALMLSGCLYWDQEQEDALNCTWFGADCPPPDEDECSYYGTCEKKDGSTATSSSDSASTKDPSVKGAGIHGATTDHTTDHSGDTQH